MQLGSEKASRSTSRWRSIGWLSVAAAVVMAATMFFEISIEISWRPTNKMPREHPHHVHGMMSGNSAKESQGVQAPRATSAALRVPAVPAAVAGQPVEPSPDAPAVPAAGQPVEPSPGAPAVPAAVAGQPVEPSPGAPAVLAAVAGQPVEPSPDAPAVPAAGQPVEPSPDAPAVPAAGQPVEPSTQSEVILRPCEYPGFPADRAYEGRVNDTADNLAAPWPTSFSGGWAKALAFTPTSAALPSAGGTTSSSAKGTILKWVRPAPTKRVAVAFSGFFRNNEPGNKRVVTERVLQSYVKHLMLPNPTYDVDLFFHLYVQEGPAKALDTAAIEMIYRMPNVMGLVVEEYNADVVAELHRHFDTATLAGYLPGYQHPADQPQWLKAKGDNKDRKKHNCVGQYSEGFFSQLRKIKLAHGLIQDHAKRYGVTYDFAIRARMDRFLGMDLVLDDLPSDKISTPRYTGGTNGFLVAPFWMEDMFAVGPMDIMDRYCSLHDHLRELFNESMRLFENRKGWRADTTGVANPWFCPEWLVARMIPPERQNVFDYPVRCWEAAHEYPQAEMRRWTTSTWVSEVTTLLGPDGKLNVGLRCSRSSTAGHKITAAEKHESWRPLCAGAHRQRSDEAPWPGLYGGTWPGVLQYTPTQTCTHIKHHMPDDHPLHIKGRGNIVSWTRPEYSERAAVVFSGFLSSADAGAIGLRAAPLQRTLQSYLKHLVLPNPDHQIDYFFHVYVQDGTTRAADIAGLEMIHKLPNVMGLTVEVFDAAVVADINAQTEVLSTHDRVRGFQGFFAELRKVSLGQAMVRQHCATNRVSYSHVIRARLDRFLAADLDLDNLPTDKLTVPRSIQASTGRNFASMEWVDDTFAVGPTTLMDQYAKSYETASVAVIDASSSSPAFAHGFCLGGSLLARGLGQMKDKVHFIDYPVRCWNAVGDYTATQLAGLDNLSAWSNVGCIDAPETIVSP